MEPMPESGYPSHQTSKDLQLKLLVIVLCALSAALAQTTSDYQLGAGDVIDVKVHGHELGRTNFVVGSDGAVSFPYVGRVRLQDLTVVEAETELERKLKDGYINFPEVTIQVAEHRSRRVEVLGAVSKAGVYYLEGETTVRGLIARAGGVKDEGGVILVTRAGTTTRIGMADLEGPLGDMPVNPGDVVAVDPAGSMVYLAGSVNKPGAIQFTEGLTLSQALIRGGGSSAVGRLSGTYILRGDERISVNLKRVLKGKDADIELRPSDRIVVPESAL